MEYTKSFQFITIQIIGLDSHLNRLQDGLDAINIKNPHSKDEWKKLINKIISLDSINKNQADLFANF